MRRAVGLSLVAHAAVITVAYFGLPHLTEPPLDQPMVTVDVAVVSELTNAPSRAPQPANPAPPPPPPPRAETPPPPPPPPPPPRPAEPQVAAVPPKPEPAPEPLPKPKPPEAKPPEVKPEPKPVQAPPPAPRVLDDIKPARKPKPADPFASVLRTVENLKQAAPAEKPKEPAKTPAKPAENFEQQIAKALSTSQRPFDASQPISISEIDLVRRQIAECWLLPAGAKDAENLVIEIRVVMNVDGTVREARISDQSRMGRDPFFRAAAESALRAVSNPKCQPLKLPPEKYAQWQTMTLNFNPKQMFGT